MADSTPKVTPPPKTTPGNGQARPTPSGPSPWVREKFIKDIRRRNNPKSPTPPPAKPK